MPGFGGIGDATARSVRIDQPRRALHMDEEHVDLGAGIGDFQTAAGEKSFFDRAAVRIFLDPAVAAAAEDEIRVHSFRPVRVVDVDEVRGAPVEGKAELRIRPSPYLDLGFVESGDEAGPFSSGQIRNGTNWASKNARAAAASGNRCPPPRRRAGGRRPKCRASRSCTASPPLHAGDSAEAKRSPAPGRPQTSRAAPKRRPARDEKPWPPASRSVFRFGGDQLPIRVA